MRTKFRALFIGAAFVAVGGGLFATSSSASAVVAPGGGVQVTMGKVCNVTGLCGKVNTSKYSHKRGVIIADGWSKSEKRPPDNATRKVLKPGQFSKSYFKDTDAYHISKGCKGYYFNSQGRTQSVGSGWHKITDVQNIRTLKEKC